MVGRANGTFLLPRFTLFDWPIDAPASGRPTNMTISLVTVAKFARYVDITAQVVLRYFPSSFEKYVKLQAYVYHSVVHYVHGTSL